MTITETLELPDGATIEFLTPVEDGVPCVMRGTIPPGGVVPLHSHADPETFLMLEGEMEGYTDDGWHLGALRLLERDAGGERRDRDHPVRPCSSAPLTPASSALSR